MKRDSSVTVPPPTRQFQAWLQQREGRYLIDRSGAVIRRYGITRTRARDRVSALIEAMAAFDCRPTLPTPGRVVRSDPAFFREIQSLGAELALHGYDHVDFRGLSREQARAQFELAASAYEHNGIEYYGFRCPYLSYSDGLLDLLPEGIRYSSNRAIWWDVRAVTSMHARAAMVETLKTFYRADSADSVVSVPSLKRAVVEIPAALPHDLLLHDRFRLGVDGSRQAWTEILHETHRRGELFNLLFHPESFWVTRDAIEAVLAEARSLKPGVWVTRLREIDVWWREKASFSAEIADGTLRFHCSERATILGRSLGEVRGTRPWDGSYDLVDARTIALPTSLRPLLGIAPGTPQRVVDFLANEGYILDSSESRERCGLVIDARVVERAATDAALVRHIESSDAPLVRYWRWPSRARSALCLSGDLDALTLIDYALRFPRLWRGARRSDDTALGST
jgi:peptidoglycan/xylan/chitin deacetylase (PgdA/CDA1 family)